MRLHLTLGAADSVVPPDAVAAVRHAFAGHDDVRIIVHEGATHGFSHRAAPKAYNPAAERAGMASLFELVPGHPRADGAQRVIATDVPDRVVPTLETAQLALRPITMADAPALLSLFGDPR
jgi:hypothetical protein